MRTNLLSTMILAATTLVPSAGFATIAERHLPEGARAFFSLLLAMGIGVYAAPAIVAFKRDHPNMVAIVVLTLLPGWTFHRVGGRVGLGKHRNSGALKQWWSGMSKAPCAAGLRSSRSTLPDRPGVRQGKSESREQVTLE